MLDSSQPQAALRFGQLALNNFKSWRGNHTVELGRAPGVYFVAGKNLLQPDLEANGAGKSTLFADAIFWVFTGRLIRAQRPGAMVEPWSDAKSVVRVELEFFRHGWHRIARQRNPNGLTLDGNPVEQGVIYTLLGLSDEALRRTVIIGQFGTLFLDLRPEEQARLFNETLNLDRWLRAADLAGQRATKEQALLDGHKLSLATLGAKQESLDQGYKSAAAAEADYEKQRQNNIAAATEAVQSAEAQLARVESAEFTSDQAKAVETATASVDRAKQALAAFEANPVMPESPRRGQLARDLAEANRVLGLLNESFLPPPPADNEIHEAVLELAKQRQAWTVMEGERRALGVKRGKQSAAAEAAGKKKDAYNVVQPQKVCPECGQDVTDKHWEDKKLEAGLAYDAAANLLMVTDMDIANYDQQLTERAANLKVLDDKLNELHRLARSARDIALRHENDLAKQRDVIAALERDLAELVSNDKSAAQLKLNDLRHEVTRAETALESVCDKIAAAWESIKAVATTDLNIAKTTLENWKTAPNLHTATAEAFRRQRDQAAADQAVEEQRLSKAQERHERYKYWVTGFKEIRLKLIDDVLLELEIATNRHAEGLGLHGWSIQFATERETVAGTVSRGFTTVLRSPEFAEPVPWESYSGGEAQRWQLACAFALAEVLLGRGGIVPNIEVLDEPTQHLSQQGIDDLLSHLKDRASALGRAIYFIDHRSLDRGSFDGMLTVTKDTGGSHLEPIV